MEASRVTLEFIVGGAFVVWYSFSRFSATTTESRASIDVRYWFALLLYVLTIMLVYMLLTVVIQIGITTAFSAQLDAIVRDIGKALPDGNEKLSAQLVAALVLTEGMPRIETLATTDKKLRMFFQRMASLSAAAQNLSTKFRFEEFRLAPAQVQEIGARFAADGLDERHVRLERQDDPQHTWTRVTLLWLCVDGWSEDPEYGRFLERFAGELSELRLARDALAGKAKHCFSLSRASAADRELGMALSDCAKHYSTQLKHHLQKLADFSSRALLSTHKSREARRRAIERMGFQPYFYQGLSLDHLTLLFVTLFGVFITGFLLANWASQAKGGPQVLDTDRLLLAVRIAVSYCIAVVCAMLSREISARRDTEGHAWVSYLIVSVLAGVCSSTISILTYAISGTGNLYEAFATFGARWPWQIPVVMVTFAVSVLIHRPLDPQRVVLTDRAFEGAITAAIVLFGGLLAYTLLSKPPPAYWMFPMMAAIGLIIGFFVPTWYRGAPRGPTSEMKEMVDIARLGWRQQ